MVTMAREFWPRAGGKPNEPPRSLWSNENLWWFFRELLACPSWDHCPLGGEANVKHVLILFGIMFTISEGSTFAEFRSAQDVQKECRVALDLAHGMVEKDFDNTLLAGECVGFIQGAVDTAVNLGESISWYKVCVPEAANTRVLIQKFIAFVDKNPKITLASSAITTMLAAEFPCPKKTGPPE
jgi:hypothetical protein